MKKNKNDSPEGGKKKGSHKLLFLGLGTLAVGVLSYFGWNYFSSRSKQTSADENDPDLTKDNFNKDSKKAGTSHSTSHTATKKSSGKQNSVKQQPKSSTSTSSNTKSTTQEKIKLDSANVAMQLAKSITQKQYLKTVTLLNLLKSTSDYNAVNTVFKTYRVNGVHQTLVNAMLSTFTETHQKLIMKAELLRIGLKHNVQTDKWSLSGTNNPRTLITVSPTKVWKSPRHSVSVPHNMILGEEIAQRGNHTLFENEQEYYLVPSAHVRYHRPKQN